MSIDCSGSRRQRDWARRELLALRNPDGFWDGQLSSSGLATAAAISALAVVQRHRSAGTDGQKDEDPPWLGVLYRGLEWLADHQNADGGWSHAPGADSSLDATLLVLAAFQLTGVPADHDDLLARGQAFVDRAGGVPALRRQLAGDRTWLGMTLANCAVAEMVKWREVPQLPFEAAVAGIPGARALRKPLDPAWLPGLVAVGWARFRFAGCWNPLVALWRRAATDPALKQLRQWQSPDGGWQASVPLTSWLVMCLAAGGRAHHEMVERGVAYLARLARPDGGWPVTQDMAVRVTSAAILALSGEGPDGAEDAEDAEDVASLDWLLSVRRTGALDGGWSWSAAEGARSTVIETAEVLLALRRFHDTAGRDAEQRRRIAAAARAGIAWLCRAQRIEGGWPICGASDESDRGRGMSSDPTSAEATARVIQALQAWQSAVEGLDSVVSWGKVYLLRHQRLDGSWPDSSAELSTSTPQQRHVAELLGTAEAVRAWSASGQSAEESCRRAVGYLVEAQQADGSWNCEPPEVPCGEQDGDERASVRIRGRASIAVQSAGVEVTCKVLDALHRSGLVGPVLDAWRRGVAWLVEAMDRCWLQQPGLAGMHLGKIWYGERTESLAAALTVLGVNECDLIPTNGRSAGRAFEKEIAPQARPAAEPADLVPVPVSAPFPSL